MPVEDYIYAAARVHMHERGLLGRQELEQLISARNTAEVLRLLTDKGWGAGEAASRNADDFLAAELDRAWALVLELAPNDKEFGVFTATVDYHNLKAAIKLVCSGGDTGDSRYFIERGGIAIEEIIKAAETHDFSALPTELAKAGDEAYKALSSTGNGQLCDAIADRYALIAVDKAGKASQSELLCNYSTLLVDCANLKSAWRCAAMKKQRQLIDELLAPAGSLDIKELAKAAEASVDAVCELAKKLPKGGEEALAESLAAFECWRDNTIIGWIRPYKYASMGIEPLAAYIIGRENEIKLVRLILSAKAGNLDEDAVRERLRDTYV